MGGGPATTALQSRRLAMRKVWVLDTETKGTGAQMVPLEKVLRQPAGEARPSTRSRKSRPSSADRPPEANPRARARKLDRRVRRTTLPPGHVRKTATGEIGRVRSVDAKAGTASVLWLRQGRTSTVPLTAISRY
jgi:hypothetical protein